MACSSCNKKRAVKKAVIQKKTQVLSVKQLTKKEGQIVEYQGKKYIVNA